MRGGEQLTSKLHVSQSFLCGRFLRLPEETLSQYQHYPMSQEGLQTGGPNMDLHTEPGSASSQEAPTWTQPLLEPP